MNAPDRLPSKFSASWWVGAVLSLLVMASSTMACFLVGVDLVRQGGWNGLLGCWFVFVGFAFGIAAVATASHKFSE